MRLQPGQRRSAICNARPNPGEHRPLACRGRRPADRTERPVTFFPERAPHYRTGASAAVQVLSAEHAASPDQCKIARGDPTQSRAKFPASRRQRQASRLCSPPAHSAGYGWLQDFPGSTGRWPVAVGGPPTAPNVLRRYSRRAPRRRLPQRCNVALRNTPPPRINATSLAEIPQSLLRGSRRAAGNNRRAACAPQNFRRATRRSRLIPVLGAPDHLKPSFAVTQCPSAVRPAGKMPGLQQTRRLANARNPSDSVSTPGVQSLLLPNSTEQRTEPPPLPETDQPEQRQSPKHRPRLRNGRHNLISIKHRSVGSAES